MKFDISINNFGKINNANIKIRPFTVIAGPNSSGKSFVTKSLYSFFSTINIDHVTVETFNKVNDLKRIAAYLHVSLSNPSQTVKNSLADFLSRISVIEATIDDTFGKNTFSDQVSRAFLLKESINELENSFNKLNEQISNKVKYQKAKDHIDNIKQNINFLKRIADNPTYFLSLGIENGFINSLKENFQVSNLSDLKNYHADDDSIIKFDFDTLGGIEIKKEVLSFSLNKNRVDEFQNLYNVVYIESPVYWKMKSALESVKKNKRFFSISRIKQTDYLIGIPKHFYDLVDLIENQPKSSGTIELEKNAIKDAIGGEIVVSKSGDLVFKEAGYEKSINLHSTALGVTNLGIILFLLERGVLAKGSYLFVDEPEVHLHPSWQKIMIDTLFELSKKGINIVIASHSIDMMKCVENIMGQEESLKLDEHFGINQLSADGNSLNGNDNVFKRIASIKEDLGKSFYEMFIDSNW